MQNGILEGKSLARISTRIVTMSLVGRYLTRNLVERNLVWNEFSMKGIRWETCIFKEWKVAELVISWKKDRNMMQPWNWEIALHSNGYIIPEKLIHSPEPQLEATVAMPTGAGIFLYRLTGGSGLLILIGGSLDDWRRGTRGGRGLGSGPCNEMGVRLQAALWYIICSRVINGPSTFVGVLVLQKNIIL